MNIEHGGGEVATILTQRFSEVPPDGAPATEAGGAVMKVAVLERMGFLGVRRPKIGNRTSTRCSFGVLLALFAISSGCAVPSPRPVWLRDSTAVVFEQEAFFVKDRTRLALKFPMTSPMTPESFAVMAQHISESGGRTLALVNITDQKDQSGTLKIWTTRSLTAELEDPLIVPLAASDPSEGHPSLGFDIYPSPNGEQVLACIGWRTILIHLKTGTVTEVAGVTGPLYFEQVFGVSPCSPEGTGFLGFARRERRNGDQRERAEEHRAEYAEFLQAHAHPVLVSWEGKSQELKGLKSLEKMVLYPVEAGRHFSAIYRSPLTGHWEGDILELTAGSGAGGCAVDTKALMIRTLAPMAGASDAPERSVPLEGGRSAVCIRRRARSSAGSEEVVVRENESGKERIIMVDRQGRMRLFPSPDSRWVMIQVDQDKPESSLGVLIEREGQIAATFGTTEPALKERLKATLLKERQDAALHDLPARKIHDRFRAGYCVRSLAEMRYLANPIDAVPEARRCEFVELQIPVTEEVLALLASLPSLKYLSMARPGPPSLFRMLPNLAGFEGPGAALDDQQFHDGLKVLLISRSGRSEGQFSEKDVQRLAQFRTLSELRVEVHSEPGTEMKYDFSGCTSLKTLCVLNSHSRVWLEGLGKLPELRSLVVVWGLLSDSQVKQIGEATRLEDLTLEGAVTEPVDLRSLAGLSSLRKVDLSLFQEIVERRGESVDIRYADAPGTTASPLAALTSLEQLKLSFIAVAGEDLQAFAALKKLKDADLGFVSSTEEEVLKLSRAVPEATLQVGYKDIPPTHASYRGGRKVSAR